ncbi:subtype A tannase [Actinoplanes sp. NPDC051851]|uniref:subtype A tannase n=1 Tax=Actinoplanes sp. NPDC051851 TaxID=3154753 RepID=UPI003440D36B
MELRRRTFLQGAAATSAISVLGLAACTDSDGDSSTSTSTAASGSYTLSFTGDTWSYDADNDVYYQIGKYYVTKPEAPDYESLAVFVPGKYLKATKNSDGTYTATVDASGTVGDYTAATAPIVLPLNTPGYAAQAPLTEYSYDTVSEYLKAGFVYVHAGMRGKDSNTDAYVGNAPWGVTDLKAAVRYIRYNADLIPGSKDRMVTFGHSGGGAQSAIMGASGDSELYTPYLTALGAALTDASGKDISDAIAGAMCWCPITNLDYANAAYEWNMGQFATTDTRADGTWTKSYSTELAKAFAAYQNKLGLKDSSGATLSLDKTGSGVYLGGKYYDHIVSVVQKSLNDFLKDTTFPYTPTNSFMAGNGGGGAPGGAGMPSGAAPGGAGMPSGAAPGGAGMPSGAAAGGGGIPGSGAQQDTTTYKTVKEYIAHLNEDTTWVKYDASSNSATITGLAGFVKSQKNASKAVGAFDGPDRSMTENVVFGDGTAGLHFSPVAEQVIEANEAAFATISGWQTTYASSEYTTDFAKTDTVGKDMTYRVNMYNPMYYLTDFYEGYQSGTVAPHWRIRTGIMQGDTANTTEVNLSLALGVYDGVEDVDFETVWGQGHTMAERTGEATTNFIAWVKDVVAK